MSNKIAGTEDAWESRQLGADEQFAEAVDDAELDHRLDRLAGLKMISLRVPERLVEDFRIIAKTHGSLGYQTLMKQSLKRFADSELKWMARSMAGEQTKKAGSAAKARVKVERASDDDAPEEQRKVA